MDALRTCERCGQKYHWRKSTSKSLKLTFCSQLCEARAGCTIEDLMRAQRDEMKVEVRRMVRMFRERYERRGMTYWEMFREMSRADAR